MIRKIVHPCWRKDLKPNLKLNEESKHRPKRTEEGGKKGSRRGRKESKERMFVQKKEGCFSRGVEGRKGGRGQTTYTRAREKSDAVENNPTRSINTIRHSVLACTSRSSDAYLARVTSSLEVILPQLITLENPREAAITAVQLLHSSRF